MSCVIIFSYILFQVIYPSTSLHFGHTLERQKNWHKLHESYAQCAFGVYQTPIHIESHRTESIVMPALDFSGYDNFLAPPIKLINNGHTVKLTSGRYSTDSLYNQPSVRGGLLANDYVMESLHFHWGIENDRGSEHVVNHVRFPMEMHIVHRNRNYTSWDDALKRKDGVVVLAFFFQLRVKDNRRYRPIVDQLKHVAEKGSSTELEKSFALGTILPREKDFFYTYEGSLTTPPCAEAVTWFIFPDPIPISFAQIQSFRKLAIEDNFRNLKPVGQRKIFLRHHGRFIRPHFPEYTRQNVSSKLFWLRV